MFTLVGPYFDWIRGTVLLIRTVSSYHLLFAVLNWFTFNFKMVYWSFGQSNMHCTLNAAHKSQEGIKYTIRNS